MRKIPRGKGYDKAATLKHWKTVCKSGAFVPAYVKEHGLHLDTFMLAVMTYCPHLVHPSQFPYNQVCEYCKEVYWPSRKGTQYCSKKCGNDASTDRNYFGGKRQTTVGLAEGVCRLCGRSVQKGLSSHHLYGKNNDPGNDHLLALCRGCHAIVSDLALKTWCDDPRALERLIVLAVSQRQGAELEKGNWQVAVSVGVWSEPLDQGK
jgi:hypothetical protein